MIEDIIRFFFKVIFEVLLPAILITIVVIYILKPEIISDIVFDILFAIMVLYFIGRIRSRIIGGKDNFWLVKVSFYFAVGVITLKDESKVTTIVAVMAFIEAFDHLFKCWLGSVVDKFTPKIDSLFKVLHVAVFGYNFK